MARILTVKNDNTLLLTAIQQLQIAQHHITYANDGIEALQQLKHSESPDALLFSIVMPTMNGFTLLKQAKYQHRDLIAIAVMPALNATQQAEYDLLIETAKLNGANFIVQTSQDLNKLVLQFEACYS